MPYILKFEGKVISTHEQLTDSLFTLAAAERAQMGAGGLQTPRVFELSWVPAIHKPVPAKGKKDEADFSEVNS